MTGFLLDTNIVSASAPTKTLREAALVRSIEGRSSSLFLSAVTITELSNGVAMLGRQHPGRRARELELWFETLVGGFGDRVLPLDTQAATIAGQLSDLARSRGSSPDLADVLIAATSARHGLTVVTLNLRHFRYFGVPVLDPLQTQIAP